MTDDITQNVKDEDFECLWEILFDDPDAKKEYYEKDIFAAMGDNVAHYLGKCMKDYTDKLNDKCPQKILPHCLILLVTGALRSVTINYYTMLKSNPVLLQDMSVVEFFKKTCGDLMLNIEKDFKIAEEQKNKE